MIFYGPQIYMYYTQRLHSGHVIVILSQYPSLLYWYRRLLYADSGYINTFKSNQVHQRGVHIFYFCWPHSFSPRWCSSCACWSSPVSPSRRPAVLGRSAWWSPVWPGAASAAAGNKPGPLGSPSSGTAGRPSPLQSTAGNINHMSRLHWNTTRLKYYLFVSYDVNVRTGVSDTAPVA